MPADPKAGPTSGLRPGRPAAQPAARPAARPAACPAAASFALILALASPAAAHPHVFIDGGLGFVVDGENRLTHLTVAWEFDLFYSVFLMAEEGIDPDGDGVLTEAEGKTIADLHSQWMPGFEGDSYVWVDGIALALSGPLRARAASLPDGRVRMEFMRELAAPVAVEGAAVEAKAYDPTYYTYYAITDAPQVLGGSGCRADLIPVEIDGALASLQQNLWDYDPYSAPEDPEVGALFADTITLTCG